MEKSESIKELAAALSKAQSEIEDATKDKSGYNYKYADLSQVLQIIRPVFGKYGLSLTQFPGGDGEKVIIESMLMHSSGEWISKEYSMTIEPSKGMTLAQGAGSVITYMRRYAAASIAGITQEDTEAAMKRDGNAQEEALKLQKKAHDDALRDNLASVNAVKLGIADGDLSTAAEAWQELTEDIQRALWLATTKGGIFTTEERKAIKEQFSAALNGA